MPWLSLLCLRLLHLLYSLVIAVYSILGRWLRKEPVPLAGPRGKTPNHLAVVLVCAEDKASEANVQEAFVQCVENGAAMCKMAGIKQLTFFDRHGILVSSAKEIKQRLIERSVDADQSKPTIMYPPTPPSSDDSDSQFSGDEPSDLSSNVVVVSPEYVEIETFRKSGWNRVGVRRRGSRHTSSPATPSLRIQVTCPTAGKLTMVSVANSLLRAAQLEAIITTKAKKFHISVEDLQHILESERGLAAPDLMLVHHVTCPKREKPPAELHSFPPWQIRLTEIFHTPSWSLRARILRHVAGTPTPCSRLTEIELRRALDEYTKAEFRVGK